MVYGKDHCPTCTATERELNKVGAPHVKVNLAELDPQEYAQVTSGHLQAPVVVPPAGESWSAHRPTLIGEMPALTEPGPSL
ncbi:NrdH-redoxin [Cellulomonas hominis]|nr:NrdH-redoxin [Cellulomonas hominis]